VKVVLRAAAAADIEDAFRWYPDKQRGLGDAFLEALRVAMLRVASGCSPLEATPMEALKILELERSPHVDWDYDEEADVLYLRIGKPRKAIGVDIGDGVAVRCDEKKKEVVGLTVLGMREAARFPEGASTSQYSCTPVRS
jgi:uncharacterized protein YuzE